MHQGLWIRDWVALVLLVVGKDEAGEDITVPSVPIWGVTKQRHQPKTDVWTLDLPVMDVL